MDLVAPTLATQKFIFLQTNGGLPWLFLLTIKNPEIMMWNIYSQAHAWMS